MASTFSGIEIGKSGLTAAQIALSVTGQNISNADTDGYTMQRVNTAPVEPVGRGYLIRQITASSNVGQGVSVVSIDQVRSAYLDEQYRGRYSDFCSSEFCEQGLSYLENLFDETDEDTGLTASISNLFGALNDFAEDPSSEAARTTVQQTAQSMTENFNMIYKEMIDLYNDQNSSVKAVATQINELSSQIANLNQQIYEYERSGQNANELRDSRNLLLDELSGYGRISYDEDDTGMVNVSLSGESLVDGRNYSKIAVSTAPDEINAICQQLQGFNQTIAGGGALTPEEETERDNLCQTLEKISGKISANVDGGTGMTSVSMTYVDQSSMTQVSADLLDGTAYAAVPNGAAAEYAGADDKYVLKLGDTYLNADTVGSGELYAHLSLRDGTEEENAGIPYYIGRLDGLAQLIAQTFNDCMNAGYTYPDDGNGNLSVTGVDMFDDFGDRYDLITGGNFSLSADVLDSVWNIAGSSEPIDLNAVSGTTNASNNEVALGLSKLIDSNDYSDCLDSIVSHLGLEIYSRKNELDTRQTLVESLENQRQSVSGVSIDEEAVSLIKYQQVYNACSRVVTTIDDMLDRLISGTGRVGL